MSTRSTRIASNNPVAIEALETRRLLSAAATDIGLAELHGGQLRVTGTRAADVIVISLNPADAAQVDVTVNNTVIGTFAVDQVTQGVHVRAGKGDDTVRVDDSFGLVPLHLLAHGEQGNDTLVGSHLDDELYGGVGKDVLYGNDGNDVLHGEQGKDLLVGGFGNDELHGGHASDVLYGEAGADVLFGGNGKDLLDGGDDDDQLDGGRGFDQLTGGLGIDTFAGTDKADEILDKAEEDVHNVLPNNGGRRKGR